MQYNNVLPDINEFDLKTDTDLCKIFKKNKISKSLNHNYTKLYTYLFKNIKTDKPLNILELNCECYIDVNKKTNKKKIYEIWRDYKLNSNVYCMNMKTNEIIYDTNLNMICVQNDEKSIDLIFHKPHLHKIEFDIIIENVSKHVDDVIVMTEYIVKNKKLSISGIYIIENIHFDDVKFYKNQVLLWKSLYHDFDFRFYAVPKFSVWDNNVIVITRLN